MKDVIKQENLRCKKNFCYPKNKHVSTAILQPYIQVPTTRFNLYFKNIFQVKKKKKHSSYIHCQNQFADSLQL